MKPPTTELAPAWSDIWLGFELTLMSEGKSPSTIRNRRVAVTALARHATADGIAPAEVSQAWLKRYLLLQMKGRQGNGYQRVYEDLRAFWRWHEAETGAPSPLAGIAAPREVETSVPVLTAAQVDAVLKAIPGRTLKDARDRAIIELLLGSGIRRQELCDLDITDADLKTGAVTIRSGKGGKFRVAVMGDAARTALWRYQRARGNPSDGPLFTSRTGRRLSPTGLSQILAAAGERAGIRGLRAHEFRHTWAHVLKEAGVSEEVLMTLGGWSSPEMLARYGRSLRQKRAIDAGRAYQVSAMIRKAAS